MTKKFPKEETFGLTSQIERSVNSMGVCLAERSGKIAFEQKTHCTKRAYSTTLETLNHFIGFTFCLPFLYPLLTLSQPFGNSLVTLC
ncbi:four helix bundle protein [Pedobacter sp. GR22-10]|uniref:four helix bundle protein n=1 Tax=Pedobacter sp. GR22-10 TaxID=2994472 RepID=UPI0022465740|nr:four helix bundle protein [Pedobacter sp. GR22-10]MCX2431347.1 four helix bundle protein [Pedobacter sp. GR22-10]